MKDWKDNKYGLEAGYSALNESESFWMVLRIWIPLLALVGCIVGVLWGLFTLLR